MVTQPFGKIRLADAKGTKNYKYFIYFFFIYTTLSQSNIKLNILFMWEEGRVIIIIKITMAYRCNIQKWRELTFISLSPCISLPI